MKIKTLKSNTFFNQTARCKSPVWSERGQRMTSSLNKNSGARGVGKKHPRHRGAHAARKRSPVTLKREINTRLILLLLLLRNYLSVIKFL